MSYQIKPLINCECDNRFKVLTIKELSIIYQIPVNVLNEFKQNGFLHLSFEFKGLKYYHLSNEFFTQF